MGDTPLNKALANDLNGMDLSGLDDPALNERLEELKALQTAPLQEGKDVKLISALRSAWVGIYGAESAWPPELQNAFQSIAANQGFGSFDDGLIAVLQNLRLNEMTVPAFEAALNVAQDFSPACATLLAETRSGFIPESAARAGLSFISDPATLILPIYGGSALGKIAQVLIGRAGVALGLAGEASGALAEVGGLFAEATGFVVTGDAIQYVA